MNINGITLHAWPFIAAGIVLIIALIVQRKQTIQSKQTKMIRRLYNSLEDSLQIIKKHAPADNNILEFIDIAECRLAHAVNMLGGPF